MKVYFVDEHRPNLPTFTVMLNHQGKFYAIARDASEELVRIVEQVPNTEIVRMTKREFDLQCREE